jgi:amylosucrase
MAFLDPLSTRISALLDEGHVDSRTRAEAEERLAAFGSRLIASLEEAYDVGAAATMLPDLAAVIADAIAQRPAPLLARDRNRLLTPDLLQRPDQIGYATYVDRFAGNLPGVAAHIGHLRSLGVTYLHLLPLLATRPGPDDGGYAIADYDRVRPDLGTMDDLGALCSDLHDAGISVTVDLVLNHVAREHRWAQAAREGDPRYLNYFYVLTDRTEVDAYEAALPEVFPEFAPGNFTYCEELDGWVWTTFNSWQWDVNWSNPQVFIEYASIMLALANRGVDCLRLDAIAFIVKQMGTTCQNLPGVHVLTAALRDVLRIVAPSVTLKAEAIVAPDDLVAYLGQGRFAGRVSELAYHNSLMVQIWSALATCDARIMSVALQRFAPIPVTSQWVTYLRCHDDIGWAIDDADAAAVGWSGPEHRAFLAAYYRGDFAGSRARGADFQDNPATGDKRTSGTAASLTGVEAGILDDDLDIVERGVQRLLLGYTMIYGFGGIPLIWMGDEIALMNDHSFAVDPQHADDNRWLHRPAMDWDLVERSATRDDEAVAGDDLPLYAASRTLEGLRHLGQVRALLPVLHAACSTRVEVPGDPAVVLFTRQAANGLLIEVYNVCDEPRSIPVGALIDRGLPDPRTTHHDALGVFPVEVIGDLLELRPLARHWFTA